ncbi:MAG: hypothetical protein J0H65_08585 [Rhizobiales bacterium]|nr:hypothetical protein [Hyphomicrobiales bacterium]
MTLFRLLPAALTALALTATAASAVTVKNIDSKDHNIAITWANKQKVETVKAGKSAKFDCPDDCGVSGPWGFSWMAKGNDTITTDGKDLVTYYDKAFKPPPV